MAPRRRAAILVFTVGALALLLLIGVGLLSSVRGQRQRIERLRATLAEPAVMDGVVDVVRARLRADLWDDSTRPPTYLNQNPATPVSWAREGAEPFDAPGPFDSWLGSTSPYFGIAFDTNGDGIQDDLVAVWRHLSYLGSDLLLTGGEFNWPDNARTNVVGDPTMYNGADPDAALRNVPIVLTQPGCLSPASCPPLPGATTNVTIAQARAVWNQPAFDPWRATHRFPYFDTNRDGHVDLYDADGDGIPDSPISFAVPRPRQKASDPGELYAVIRVVDNASMINVNAAMALDSSGDGAFDSSDLFGSGANPDFQLRGRRVCEVAVDSPLSDASRVNRGPILDVDRGPDLLQFVDYKLNGDPLLSGVVGGPSYHLDVIRRRLIGGAPTGRYRLFGAADEMALRHRGLLGAYHSQPQAVFSNGFAETLGWTRGWDAVSVPPQYDYTEPWRWCRLNAVTERFDQPPNRKGWTSLLDPDVATYPWAIRRSLFTTQSLSSSRVPGAPLAPLPGLGSYILDRTNASAAAGTAVVPAPTGAAAEEMVSLVPRWGSAATPRNPTVGELAEYIAALASALHRSAGLFNLRIDGRDFDADDAWQLALNIVDYMDNDDRPTVIRDPTAGPTLDEQVQYVGVDGQPFLGKYAARVVYDLSGNAVPSQTVYAVEIVNPYRTPINSGGAGFRVRVWDPTTMTLGATCPPAPINPRSLPAATGSTGATLGKIYINSVSASISPDGTSQVYCSSLSFDPGSIIVLYRTLEVEQLNSVEWPIDAMVVGSIPATGPADSSVVHRGLRDRNEWRLTSATLEYDTRPGPGLDMSGSGNLPNVPPSMWVMRNRGLSGRSFESVGEISRLLAIGTVRTAPFGAPGYNFRTPPEYLAGASAFDLAYGRINFADPNARSAAVFHALSGVSAMRDGYDNDGDGIADEPAEPAKVAYRVAGQININTAPTAVLRAVPWMFSAAGNWDLAAAIVSYREGRPINSLLGSTADLSGAPDAGNPLEPFRAMSDLGRVTTTDARFDVARFAATYGGAPPAPLDNGGNPNAPEPDYDRTSDNVPNDLKDVRARDLFLARWGNLLTTRSDVFTVYIVLLDEEGRYVRRSQFTVDRSACAAEDYAGRPPVLPLVAHRVDTDYFDDTR